MADIDADRFQYALVRKPADNFGDGLTTAVWTDPPDLEKMRAQHAAYTDLLEELGLTVLMLDADPAFPDGHFVEDAAVVFPEAAVITRPGAASRRGETEVVASVLARHRPLRFIDPPGTLDGGDVLMVGRRFFIGLSSRTNAAGATRLADILQGFGYAASFVSVEDGLHLKSGVNAIADGRLIVAPLFATHPAFDSYEKIVVDGEEAYAANTLWINGCLIMPAGYPKTRRKLAALGQDIRELETGETRKMDGGLTCLSIRF